MKLEEAFFDYKKAPSFLSKKVGKNYEIFVNPTRKEMIGFDEDGFRFLADAKKKKLYIFHPYILHEMAAYDIWGDDIELYKAPWILLGASSGKRPSIDYLTPFEEGAKRIFGKKYYEELKNYDWSWLKKYIDTKELENKLETIK
jgi:hypothetical protein